MDTQPFIGSDAIRRGMITPAQLRGNTVVRLFRDVYVAASTPLSLTVRSRAAYLLVEPIGGLLVGYSAAELLGATCAPRDADAEVGVRRAVRDQPGLRVHRDLLTDDEIAEVDGILLTTALRTAYDLARWLPLSEAVAAVDALSRHGRFDPRAVLDVDARHPRARWRRRVPQVIAFADPGAESPWESRCRLALVRHNLPRPRTQHRVLGPDGRPIARLDLAYPAERVGIEFDGRWHRDEAAAARDRRRDNDLAALGWVVLRFTADDVSRRADTMADRVRRTLRGRRRLAA